MAELVIAGWGLLPTITICLSFFIYCFIHLPPAVQGSGMSPVPLKTSCQWWEKPELPQTGARLQGREPCPSTRIAGFTS